MFRMRGALAFAVAATLTGGACGGTDWNAAHKPKTPSAAQIRAAAAAEAKAEVPYVDALVASGQANSDPSDPTTPADARCWATAIVHGVGVKAFAAHGLTPNGLRNPNSTLDALPTPTAAQAEAIGAAMQHCRLGVISAAVLYGIGVTDAQSVTCFSRALGRPVARRFLGVLLIGAHRMNLATAHTVVGLLAGCIDLAALVVRTIDLPPVASIRQCVVTVLHGSDAELKDLMALNLSDADPEQIQEARDALSVSMNECRPGAQTGFTVPGD